MSLPLCKFFSSNQTCKFGKHCRFSHSTQRTLDLPVKDFVEPVRKYEENLNSNLFSSDSTNTVTGNTEETKTTEDGDRVSEQFKGGSLKNTLISKKGARPQQGKPICHFYANGYCKYGRSCRFSHDVSKKASKSNASAYKKYKTTQELPPRFQNKLGGSEDDATCETVGDDKENSSEQAATGCDGQRQPNFVPLEKNETCQTAEKAVERKICPFFKHNRCKRGQRCRFLHTRDIISEEPIANKANASAIGEAPQSSRDIPKIQKPHSTNLDGPRNLNVPSRFQRQPQVDPRRSLASGLVFTLQELEEVGSSKVKGNEINYIKKRFPKGKITVEDEGDSFTASVCFEPSDPDWPFDIKSFPLSVTVPADYPKSLLVISVLADEALPETVRRYLEVTIQEWLQDKKAQLESSGKVELVLRPFIRWLDRSLEEIITKALTQLKRELIAKAAGLEFIPAEKLQAKFQSNVESPEEHHSSEESDDSNDDEESSDELEDSDSESENEEEANRGATCTLDLDPQKKGTEITLRHLQLKEKASAMTFDKLKLVIQCDRCKTHADLMAFPGKVMSLQCEKCSHTQYVSFRPALVHQFSSVVGYLDLNGCQAFDLILQDCQAVVSCMACSKQTTINGLVSGQLIDGWCKACNGRFKVAIDSVKFSQLAPSGVDTTSVDKVVEIPTRKAKRVIKDPSIKEGFPLPEFGTCKHYKHSYRWLRFPCCGKTYPCDVCHDRKEDHEMQFANRMICGYCSKEQNYSASRPCQFCFKHLTKIRSAHWEGGSGCRDKVAMSKNDTQKYSNMNKTLSNHKKKVQAGSKGSTKKNTKLRHA